MSEDVATIGIKIETVGLEKAKLSLADLAGSGKKAESAIGNLQSASERAQRSLSSLGSVAAGVVAGMGVSELIHLSDQYAKYTAQLKLATTSTTAYANAMTQVRAISTAAQQDISSVGTLFARISNGTRELGLSQQKMAAITETVALSLKVSEAAASESASAMLQLSQAFASGQLRGEEFNAVNEAAPRLMKALADGIGVPVGALREMASQGKITSEVMANALPRALAELRDEAKSVQTIAGSFTVLKNNILEFVGTQSQASGAVKILASGIDGLANNLDVITAAAGGLAAAKLADTLIGVTSATAKGVGGTLAYAEALTVQRNAAIAAAQAEVASTTATAANLEATQAAILVSREEYAAKLASANATVTTSRAALQQAAATIASSSASLQAAQSAGALSFALATARESSIALTGAQASQVAATEALAVAERQRVASLAELAIIGQQQARVSAQVTAATTAQVAAQTALATATSAGGAAAGIAMRALGLLGGPIGAVTTLLGLGATAWMLWGSSSKSAQQTAASAVEASTAEIIANLDKQNAKLRERIALGKQLGMALGQEPTDAQKRQFAIGQQIDNLRAGRGIDGGEAPPEAARVALMQTLLRQYGELESKIGESKSLKGEDESTKSANALVDARMRLLGVNKQYYDDLKLYQAALESGAIGEAQYVEELKQLAQRTWDASAAGKEEAKAKREQTKERKSAESAAKQELSAYQALLSTANQHIAQNKELISGIKNLTESQKLEIKLNEDLLSGKLKLGSVHEADIRARIAILAAQERSIAATKREVETYREQIANQEAIAADLVAQSKAREEGRKALDAYYNEVKDGTRQLQLEASLIGKSNVERATAIGQYQALIKYEKELQRIRDNTGYDEGQREEARAEALATYTQDVTNASNKAVLDEWNNTVNQVESIFVTGFADMMNNGKSGWDSFCKSLKTSFFTLVAKEIYTMFAKPFVVQLVGSFLGIAGGGAGGAAMQAVSGAGGLMNMFSAGSSAYSLFSGNTFVETVAGWLGLGGGASAYALGTGATGLGLTAGGGLGLTAGGGLGLSAGAGVGAAGASSGWLASIPGWGWALAGITALFGGDIWNGLFGRKLKDTGIEGKYDSGDFTGNTYEYYKGGLFRSNKTVRKPLDEETAKGFSDQFTALDKSVREMADAVGLGSGALDTFSYSFKLSLKGLSEEETIKKIQEEFLKVGDAMAGVVLTTDEYNKAGENQLEALTRLAASIKTVNDFLRATGDQLFQVGLAGADMASQLIDAFGGQENFSSISANYYDKYFSDAEKLANVNRQVSESFEKLGLGSVPASRDALKELIKAQDLTTEEGRKTYASLLALAGVLDVVYSSAEQLASLNFDLDVELLRAQGRDAEAIALEREKRVKELMQFGDDIVAKQRKIWEEQDKRRAEEQAREVAEALKRQQEEAQNKAMRNLEYAVGRDVNALNAQKAALQEQRNLANESYSLITGIFDLVHQQARELYSSVDPVAAMQASQGRAFITQALGAALKTGYLPDKDQLAEAISAARSGIDEGAYKSQVERDYDTMVLAGQLAALEAVSGKQKTVAEQQLESLDLQIKGIDRQTKALQDQLAQIKDLVAISKGEYDATISVEQAVRDVYRLFDLRTSKPPEGSKGTTDPAGDVIGGGGPSAPVENHLPGERTKDGAYWMEVITPTGSFMDISTGAKTARLQAADKWLDQWRGTGDVAGMLNSAKAAGYSMHDLSTVMGWSWKDLVDAGKRLGIPQFAKGTNYVTQDTLAVVHEGERIMPKSDNLALMAALRNGAGNSSGDIQMLAAMQRLEDRLAEIENNTAKGAEHSRRSADDLGQVSEGGNAVRVILVQE